ncbi:MAG: DUF4339 domain-containing protein [Planctomycetaceae bacterium]|jgi:hypothetical protein|nr:DUF4339 domain-containing protein [Planctomycetaceae bacterium]
MTNWYYYDSNGQKQGLLTTEALQELVTQGIVIPTTKLVTETGQEGWAGQVSRLVFPTAPQPSPFSSMLAVDCKNWTRNGGE